MNDEALRILRQVASVFGDLGIKAHLGGSFASSIHGEPRSTHDVDLVVDLSPQHILPLVEHLSNEFYLDDEMIRSALERGRSFNLIHLGSGLKVDIFPLGPSAFDQSEFARSLLWSVFKDPPGKFLVKSPEDTILRKLQWYRAGGEVSDRQWRDVLGILKSQGEALDEEYLLRWAEELAIDDLLQQALNAKRRPEPPF